MECLARQGTKTLKVEIRVSDDGDIEVVMTGNSSFRWQRGEEGRESAERLVKLVSEALDPWSY